MKLKIGIYSNMTDWRYGYIGLWVDHNFCCSIFIRNDNSIKVVEYPDTVKLYQ